MSYGAYADVLGLVPELGGVTVPASGTVSTWLTNISNTVDGYLAQRGYTVPITDTEDASAIQHNVVMKVACMSVQVATLGENYRQKAEGWCKEYSDFIEAIKDGEFALTSQTPTKGRTGVFYLKKERRTHDYTRD